MRFNALSKALCFTLAILLGPVAGLAKTRYVKAPDPLSAGSYPVGVTTTIFVDASRTDNVTKKARTLVTEIWYPAADGARRLAKNKYSDFIPGGITPEIDELLKKTYRMGAAGD